MRIVWTVVIALLVYLFYGIFLSNFDLRVIPGELAARDPQGFHDYSGVINVHTNLSSGSGSPTEVIAAAQEVGLDFIFLTDLNVFEDNYKQLEGYHNNLLVFADGEFSYLNSRLLNVGVTAPRDLSGPGRAQVFFADMLGQNQRPDEQGLFILAHPLKPKYAWVGEYPVGLDGIELINLKSVWQNAWLTSRWSFFWSLLIFPFNDRLALLRLFQDPRAEVQLWDELNSRRPTFATAGADAEARLRVSNGFGLNYPSYQTLFSLVRNHVLLNTELTGDGAADRAKILQALRKGQFYLALDILADPKGFFAALIDSKGNVSPPGTQIKWQEGLELMVHLPNRPRVPFEVEIYRDGERVVQANTQDTKIRLHAPGVYRVKVRVIPTLPLPDGKQWIPWIYTNPFFVR
ncbi:MAG: hypothetical protein AB7N80_05930 [Bdellovibrionales bacterium]